MLPTMVNPTDLAENAEEEKYLDAHLAKVTIDGTKMAPYKAIYCKQIRYVLYNRYVNIDTHTNALNMISIFISTRAHTRHL